MPLGRIFRNIPLKIGLIVPFMALTFFAAGIVGYLSFLNGKKAVNMVAYQLRSEITNRIEGHLDSFLGMPKQINRLNVAMLRQGLIDVSHSEALERHFWRQVGIFDSVTSIYMGSPLGGLVNSGREGATGEQYIIATDGFEKGAFAKYATDKAGNRGALMLRVPDFDARTRQWYQYAVKAGSDVWSPVYILFTGQDMAVAASCPVYDMQGRLLGVVAVDVFLSHISHFLSHLIIGKTGQAFIVERSGLLIAASSLEKPFTVPGTLKPHQRIYATESTTPIIKHAAEAMMRETGADDVVMGKQNVEFLIDGKRHFLQVAPLKDVHGLDWFIAVVVSEADFTEQIEANNERTILFIAATLLVVIALGIFIADRISKPIVSLTDSALGLAEGEWQKEIPEKSSFVEIHTLIQTFNHMGLYLKETLNDLNHENAERRHVEMSLRESEAHLRTLIETIPDLVWLKNPEGVYLACNPQFERFFGAKEGDIVGKTDYDFVDNDLAAFFREKDLAAMTAGQPMMNEEEITYAENGQRAVLETIKTPMYDPQSKLIGVLGIARDITQRKLTEDSLRSEKEFTETTLNVQKDTLFLFDPKKRKALRWNRAFKDLSGYDDDEIAEMPAPHSYFRPNDVAKSIVSIQDELKEGTGALELELLCKDGRTVPIEYSVSSIKNDEGDPKYIILIGRDVRDRKRIEAQIHHTQKMDAIATLAGGIAHDFNNLLGVITGNVSYALSLVNRDDELYHVLLETKNGAKQAQSLTRQLLTFASGGAPIKKISKLNPLIEEAAQFVSRGAKSTCRFDLSPELWPADVDEGQISQVIHNMVINSIQAMPQGGVVTIKTQNVEISPENCFALKEGRYIQITIEDQGTGIKESVLKKIFDPFFSTKDKGSGLGLATAYSIMKRHGGQLKVYSEVGKGTAFHLFLPASPQESCVPIKKRAHEHLGRGRILLMDDQQSILKMVGRILHGMGYETVFASDGTQAIDVYQKAYETGQTFDLVILDLTIPGGMGGTETMVELQKIDPDVRAVVSSGYSNAPVMSAYENYGFCGVIPKPYSKGQLAELLNELFGGTR